MEPHQACKAHAGHVGIKSAARPYIVSVQSRAQGSIKGSRLSLSGDKSLLWHGFRLGHPADQALAQAGDKCRKHVRAPCFMGMCACGGMAVAQEAWRMMHRRQLPAFLQLLCLPGCQIAQNLHRELRCRCRLYCRDRHVCRWRGLHMASESRK